ncbi:hypothetical protein [Serratia sp. Ag2]|uniref:hypothetical protein n=1 Tax=Serratia sp. Ag2 TaxID=1532556 RepID=UPI0018CCD92F|nr:hypothetical protein [Serratia sp. Ag2]
MYVNTYRQLAWVKKLFYLLMVILGVAFLSACDSSTTQRLPANSSISSGSSNLSTESTDDKQEKPGVVRCAP